MDSESSDEELLINGGAMGFGQLYERRHALVRGYLRRRLGGRPEIVLDLVAETFARALERRDQFDPERGTAIAWLIGIAHNLLLDSARRGSVAEESRRRLRMERVRVADSELEAIERDGDSDMERALSLLPADQREAIRRRVLEDEPYATLAASVGCSEQVVRKRVSRGLASLRRSVEGNS